MKRIALAFVAGVAAIGMAQAQDLPDLGGRTIVAVTENAYTPLNFADPATGEGIGIRCLQRDRPPPQRHCRLAAGELGHDD